MPFWILLFGLLVFGTPPAAARDTIDCGNRGETAVHVTSIFDEPRLDFSQNLAGVQSIAGDHSHNHSIPHYHGVTMGITRYEPAIEFHVPLTVETRGDSMACARVDEVNISIGYRDVVVFIANEIPRYSCAFDETMAHEQKHIDANRELLDKFVPMIEERIKAYLRANSAFLVEKPENAEALVRKRLDVIANEAVAKMETENIRRQREIDSPEEYRRLAQVCDGELSKLAGRYRP
jgi:hypothetical protein